MKPIIEVNNLTKIYKLGQLHDSYLTLSDSIKQWFKHSKISDEKKYIKALDDVSFTVNEGEKIGIIGKNGAGKSTLLKILSRITPPTSGKAILRGKVASLLEVGTGFHGELTGRENIFLNGAILGMKRNEIKQKLDEIVEFSGVEKFLDTPLKHYSSGMQVRLAFAVAAHLNADILLVDEVLAVGDAEFQKKSMEKMDELRKEHGRTILFVSHNMTAVKSFCNRGILLNNGNVSSTGTIDEVVAYYLNSNAFKSQNYINIKNDGILIERISILDNGVQGCFNIDEELVFEIIIKTEKKYRAINVNLFFNAAEGGVVFATCSNAEPLNVGKYIFKCFIPANILNNIVYNIDVMVVSDSNYILIDKKNVLSIKGIEQKRDFGWFGQFPGLIRPTFFKWEKKTINNIYSE